MPTREILAKPVCERLRARRSGAAQYTSGGSLRDRGCWAYHCENSLLLSTVPEIEPDVQIVGQSSGAYQPTSGIITARRPVEVPRVM